jgi:hypothetical protein
VQQGGQHQAFRQGREPAGHSGPAGRRGADVGVQASSIAASAVGPGVWSSRDLQNPVVGDPNP